MSVDPELSAAVDPVAAVLDLDSAVCRLCFSVFSEVAVDLRVRPVEEQLHVLVVGVGRYRGKHRQALLPIIYAEIRGVFTVGGRALKPHRLRVVKAGLN